MKETNLFKLFPFIIIAIILIAVFFVNNKKEPLVEQIEDIPTENLSNIPLATNLQNIDIIDTINTYSTSSDVVEIRQGSLEKLDEIKKAQPLLIYNEKENTEEIIVLAKSYGVGMIGFNLEDAKMSCEQLAQKEKEAYTLAKENGLFFVFAPIALHVEKCGFELAKNADAIAIQLRNYQLRDNFEELVTEIIDNIKQSNPNIKIWIQLDVNPRDPNNPEVRKGISSEEVLREIEVLEEYVDLVSIFYPTNDISVVKEVYTDLRK